MAELKEQEERLRFLISRIDSEIVKFQKSLNTVEEKQSRLNEAIIKRGLQEVPINITPHSAEKQNLHQEIKQHIMDLNKLKNYINGKLEVVIKEEELIEDLKKEHGKNVSLHKLESGEFEINYKDEETEKAYNQINVSKKLINQLKKSIQDIVKE